MVTPAFRSLRRWAGRRWVRRVLAFVAVAVLVLIVTPVIGTSSARVGPGEVDIGFSPALHGRTTLALPPVGSASAPTHRGPVEVQLELQSLDVAQLVGSNGRIDATALRSSIDDDLRGAMTSVVVRFVLLGALVGLAGGAMLPRRTWRSIVLTAGEGLIVSLLLVGAAVPGFDATQFQELTFQGPVTAGGQVISALSAPGGPVGERVAALSDKLAGLYSASVTKAIDNEGEVVILHISDLHLNPIGARLARRLAESFDVDAVVDTGDTTSFGTAFEGDYAELLADFPVPYLFVGGNHDSPENREAIKATPGITALHNTSVEVGGVVVAGYDDPVITKPVDVPRDEREAIELAATPRLNALIEREHPDVLAVHNPVIAQRILGRVPLVIAGHQHTTRFGAKGGTMLSLVGSTGATGLGSLLVEEDLPASASLLRFRDGELVAIDDLEVIGTSGDMRVRRHTITAADRAGDDADFIGHDADEANVPETTTTDPDGAGTTEPDGAGTPEPDGAGTTTSGG